MLKEQMKILRTILRKQNHSLPDFKRIYRRKINRNKYEQLVPWFTPNDNPENAFRVILGDFVTTEDGTGIVHTAPTFGADDAKAKEA
jgi:isoleucyl-tRNA synthetase